MLPSADNLRQSKPGSPLALRHRDSRGFAESRIAGKKGCLRQLQRRTGGKDGSRGPCYKTKATAVTTPSPDGFPSSSQKTLKWITRYFLGFSRIACSRLLICNSDLSALL